MIFTHAAPVRFHHCDPAGIVFYPRYFDMANEAVESWFAARLGTPFWALHGPMGLATPTVSMDVRFAAPSRHGDLLSIAIRALRIGRASLDISTRITAETETRMEMRSTLVLTARDGGRPRPWPEDLRARLLAEAKLAEEETQ